MKLGMIQEGHQTPHFSWCNWISTRTNGISTRALLALRILKYIIFQIYNFPLLNKGSLRHSDPTFYKEEMWIDDKSFGMRTNRTGPTSEVQ